MKPQTTASVPFMGKVQQECDHPKYVRVDVSDEFYCLECSKIFTPQKEVSK